MNRLDDARTGGNTVAWINPAGTARAVGEHEGSYAKDEKARETSIADESPQVTHPCSVPDRKQPVYPVAAQAETEQRNGGKRLVPQRSGRSAGIANGPGPCKLLADLLA